MSEQYLELYEKLSRLQWLMQRQHTRHHAQRGPTGDPSRGQGRVLAMLRMQPEISTKDLSYLLGIRQQSLNELLGKLERAGYVTRTPSEADRRVMMVVLTDKGQEAQSEEPDLSGIFGCLSVEENRAFGEYLDRIIAALEAELGLEEEYGERYASWMDDFRARMGDERFRQWFGERGPRGFFGGFDREHGRGGRHDAERFHPDHDMQRHEGLEDFPFGRRTGRRPEPPAPPTPPIEPEEI